jgi:hypothetical protein
MTIPGRWGFCFQGSEEAFTRAIVHSLRPGFVYLEIGIGRGDCLRSVSEILAQTTVTDWRIYGVDVPAYGGDALTMNHVGSALFGPVAVGSDTPERSIALHLTGSEEFFQRSKLKPHFTFIDACHCSACPAREFLALEKSVPVGGIVCFHDTCIACQHEHSPQPCGGGIEVRSAVNALGLLTGTRQGWKIFDETQGQFPRSHGCLFVEKTDKI